MSPRLVALVVVVGIFWLLVAFSRAQLGAPWASRYVYTGAQLILLILVEAFRGVRASAAGAALVALLPGLSLLGSLRAFSDGESSLYTGSRAEAAQTGALQLARAFAPPGLVLDPHRSPAIFADQYFAAVRDLASTPADSPSQIATRPEIVRSAADFVLVRAGEIEVRSGHVAPPRGQPVTVELASGGGYARPRGCVRFLAAGPGATLELALPPAGLVLSSLTSGRCYPLTKVRARRFAREYENGPVATLAGPESVSTVARHDASPIGWHMEASPYAPLEACALPTGAPRS